MMNLAEYRRTASRLADYLPWVALVGSGVVLNKDGSFQRTAKFRGPDLDSAVAAELVAVAGRLNNAFRRLGSGWAIFVEAQRSEAATCGESTMSGVGRDQTWPPERAPRRARPPARLSEPAARTAGPSSAGSSGRA